MYNDKFNTDQAPFSIFEMSTSCFHAGKTAGDNRWIIDSGREDESEFRPTHLVLKEVDVRSREL
jgi:hypothetical protein